MYSFLTALLFLLAPLHAKESIPSMYALLAYDSISNLKTSSLIDIEKVTTTLSIIAQKTPLNLTVKTLHGQALYSSNMEQWLHSLSKKKPDIVFFYYSGHGANASIAPWPQLLFPSSQELFSSNMLCDFLSKIESKLTIVIFDCCNKKPQSPSFLRSKELTQQELPGLRSLFVHTQGQILAVSALPGTLSYADKKGSLFTSSFLKSLLKEATSETPSWNTIFEQTHDLCSRDQKSYSELHISNTK